ncbi:hypothetical protein EYF80_064737 [Liparis tanakae]|uniref:Uncharacterized protein n=1 Tax=Liparis tanakae TaxID=230148 RepID=A0A4Z2E8P4_9TELE|nr:hypothetical protein EYF80_064737 [Liparis tanakae]
MPLDPSVPLSFNPLPLDLSITWSLVGESSYQIMVHQKTTLQQTNLSRSKELNSDFSARATCLATACDGEASRSL